MPPYDASRETASRGSARRKGLLAWRRFQQHFVGLEETLEVLGEDAQWVDDLLGRGTPAQDARG